MYVEPMSKSQRFIFLYLTPYLLLLCSQHPNFCIYQDFNTEKCL